MEMNSYSNLVSVFTDIATAINAKGVDGKMTAYEMPEKILAISGGGTGGVSKIIAGNNVSISPSTGIGQVSISADVRYALETKIPEISTVTIENVEQSAYVAFPDDFAVNTIALSTSDYPLYVYLPEKNADRRARDFLVRIEVLSSPAPTVGFFGSNAESCDFESEDDDWATLEPGANLFNFTETKSTQDVD